MKIYKDKHSGEYFVVDSVAANGTASGVYISSRYDVNCFDHHVVATSLEEYYDQIYPNPKNLPVQDAGDNVLNHSWVTVEGGLAFECEQDRDEVVRRVTDTFDQDDFFVTLDLKQPNGRFLESKIRYSAVLCVSEMPHTDTVVNWSPR